MLPLVEAEPEASVLTLGGLGGVSTRGISSSSSSFSFGGILGGGTAEAAGATDFGGRGGGRVEEEEEEEESPLTSFAMSGISMLSI